MSEIKRSSVPSTAAEPKGSSFEKFANSIQLIAWTGIFTLSLLALACSAVSSLSVFCILLRDMAQILSKFAQVLQLTDFLAKGSPLGKALHLFGRNLIVWAILPYTPSDSLAALLMLVWSLGDVIRYNYYLTPTKTAAKLRYNVFLLNYPFGLFLEFCCIYNSYSAGQLKYWWAQPSTLIALAGFMLFGFRISFLQVYGQRKAFYAKKGN